MSNVFVEREGDKYVAIQNKQIIAVGRTQGQVIDRAQNIRPHDTVLAERVRNTKNGSRDKWRNT